MRSSLALAVTISVLAGPLPARSADGDTDSAPQLSSTSRPVRRGDDPATRRDWFFGQRSYPYGLIYPDAYSAAARHYVAGRAENRRLAEAGELAPGRTWGLPTAAWFEVGPAPMLNAIFSYGNVAGRLSTIALHPTNPNIVLAGGSAGSIWRTTNALATPPTWTVVGDDLPSLAIADIEFARSNPNIVYAASGDDDVSLWGMGVFKSLDGGLTWFRVDNGSAANGIPDGTVLSKIVVHATDPARVAAVARREYTGAGADLQTSVFVTLDGGLTWTRGTLPGGGTLSRFRELVGETACPQNLWAVDYPNGDIIRSTDFGLTWSNIGATGLPAFTSNTKLAVYRPNCAVPTTLFASVYSSGSLAGDPTRYAGVYVSFDSGATWALPGPTAGPSGGCLGQCSYDHEMTVDPQDPNRVYLIGRDFWASTNGGRTWANESGGFSDTGGYSGGRMHVDMHVVEVQGTGASAMIWIAGDGGVWTYDVAGDRFINRVGNLATTEFIDLAMHPVTPDLGIGGLQDNGTIMYDGRITWPTKLHGDGGFGGFLRNSSGAPAIDGAFTSYVYGTAYHSTNRGTNFTSFTNATTFSNENDEFYGPWLGTDNRFWHGAESLWYCDWPTQCDPFTRLGPNLAAITGSSYISKLSIHLQSPGNYGPFYAGTAYSRGFLQSADGVTWNNRTGTLPDRYITDIEHDQALPDHVWVTLSGFGTGHVYYSPDGGQNWQNRSGDLPNVPTNVILLDTLDPSNTWMIGTDVGVYGTSNGGTTWRVVGTNLPAVIVSDLEPGPTGLVYAATSGRSAWAIPCTSPPTGETAIGSGDNQITVSWSGSASTYEIERSLGGCGGPFTTIRTVAAPPFTYVDTPVSGGTPYGYRIRSIDGCGSVTGACVEATTTGVCTIDPSFAGVELATGGGGTCAITVRWPAATPRCGGPTVYNVYRSTTPTFTPDATNRVAACVAGLSYVDSTVLSATSYAYVVRAESTGTPGSGPCGGREEGNLVRVSGIPEVLYQTDFESGLGGWVSLLGTPPATAGDFVLGDPDGTTSGADQAQPEDDQTAAPGVNCLFTATNPGGVGSDDVDGGEVIAMSPVIDASGLASAELRLWRWHYIRDLGEDDFYMLEVSNNGGSSWNLVETLGASQSANSWTEVVANLETIVPLTANMRLRVRTSDGVAAGGNIVETAIDDVRIAAPGTCTVSSCGSLGAVGNTLRAVKSGVDVDLGWTDTQPAASSWNLYRSTDKRVNGTPFGSPLSTYRDVGAVSSPPSLYFYKLVAVCGVTEGPF